MSSSEDAVAPEGSKPAETPRTTREERRAAMAEWKAIVARYEKPSFWRASWQLLNTLGSYAALWYLMYLALAISWWLTLPLAVLAGALLVRVFIIFHDCGHGSFFRSRAANAFWGFICGMLTFTPYYHWKWEHALHHGTSGDLDRRGVGDIWTLTVQEYLESSRWKRFAYRIARNPIVLFVIAPFVLFVIWQRFPSRKASRRERHSVWAMDAAILGVAVIMSMIYGIVPYVILQLTAMLVAGSTGVWLFYVQHQFEDVYWERGEDWDYTAAALRGSSFYKLPRILQWFSGNIGYHHIHHLSPRVPNYHLEACHRSHPMFREVKPVTLLSSLRSITLRLWDESARKLVGFRHLKTLENQGERQLEKTAAGGDAAGEPERDRSDRSEG